MSLLSGLTIVAVLLVGDPRRAQRRAQRASCSRPSCSSCSGPSRGSRRCRRRRGRCAAAPSRRGGSTSSPARGRRCSTRSTRAALALDRRDSLALEGVRFRYDGERDDGWVLDGVDLRLAPGSRVVLAGPSGAGKTTLAHLLVRFIDPVHGRVTLGGVDLRELAQHEVRRARRARGAGRARVHDDDPREPAAREPGRQPRTRSGSALAATQLDDWVRSLPEGSTRSSARTASWSPAASASGSRSRARCSRTHAT